MSVYAIADLHLSFNSDKYMDIFDGWDGYVDKIKTQWTKTITDNDTVVIAGDISWAMRLKDAYQDFEFINNLPGKKILIRGNHDYWWATSKKINDFLKENEFNTISILFNNAIPVENICICGTRGWMYNYEEPEDEKIYLREIGRLKASLEYAKQYNLELVVFLHYPPVYGSQEAKEIINILIERNIKKCYYGHIHGSGIKRGVIQGEYKGIDLKLISCDYVGFKPVLVSSF